MFWEMPFIPNILKYIGQKYDKFLILGNFFSKMMLRINSNQLSFYLSQIFQSLDYGTSGIIEQFMIDYAENSPLFAHQVIWMARVEERAELAEDLLTNNQKRAVAAGLPMKIIKNMGIQEKKFWDEVDSFYEQITKISSALKPKMPKPDKKAIINSMLEVIKMPPLIYMPTNPEYRVTRIKLGSGNPMQSAAKCPIWVSFFCKKFEGPDKYFAALKNKKDDKSLLESGFKDMDENVGHLLPDKLNSRSFSMKENFMFKGSHVETSSDNKAGENYTKLSHLTEEMFPIFSAKKKAQAQHIHLSPEVKPNPHIAETPMKGNMPGFVTQSPVDSYLMKPSLSNIGVANPASSPKLSSPKKEDTEEEEVVSCIFKTFDDIRRDNLSLQIIRIFQEIFLIEKLDLFLFPYKTISSRTGDEKTIGGIIEVVPRTFSRDQIGKENKYDLHQFFKEKYGSEISTLFQEARENFIKSMAAYSVVSYILQIKDRHNGNILIDEMGHLLHIDFGFIFDISPGGNRKFENAQFKLTTEMINIMGGNKKTEPFRMYVDNTIRAFLAIRKYRELVINLVELITKSSLGCFNKKSIESLRERFMEEKNDYQAAKQMKKYINHAYKNLRTYIYDKIQYLQNKIES